MMGSRVILGWSWRIRGGAGIARGHQIEYFGLIGAFGRKAVGPTLARDSRWCIPEADGIRPAVDVRREGRELHDRDSFSRIFEKLDMLRLCSSSNTVLSEMRVYRYGRAASLGRPNERGTHTERGSK